MAIQTPTRRIRTRQYVRMLEAQSISVEEKSPASTSIPRSGTSACNVESAPVEDVKSKPFGTIHVESHFDIKSETPLLVSPIGTASTASSPGIGNDIWDSPVPSNYCLGVTGRNNVLSPLTPLSAHDASLDSTPAPEARKELLAKSVKYEASRNTVATLDTDCGAERNLQIDIAQDEDYFFKPQKLIRNLTKELKASELWYLIALYRAKLTYSRQSRTLMPRLVSRVTI